MLPKPETAHFVIADISGYTNYLTGVELDHAQDIIADLMGVVVGCLRPPFRLAKFEGDAAFFHAPADKVDGSTLQDCVESAYFAFRRRLRNIGQATSCECNACREMKHLDLKFVCHSGEFIRQKMAGREELAGRDVILVHRLLKNAVSEHLGGHAYVLFTDACVHASGIDPADQGLSGIRESIDLLGDITCWLRDLEEAWQFENERTREEVKREDAAMVYEFNIAAPRPVVWEYFTLPGQRPKWRATDAVRETRKKGRRGAGTINHCMHGAHAVIEEITDWRPFDYLTLTTLLPVPNAPKILMTYAFSEKDGVTHIEMRVAKPRPEDKEFLEQSASEFRKTITGEIGVLRKLIEQPEDFWTQTDEPALPSSASRFISEPVIKPVGDEYTG